MHFGSRVHKRVRIKGANLHYFYKKQFLILALQLTKGKCDEHNMLEKTNSNPSCLNLNSEFSEKEINWLNQTMLVASQPSISRSETESKTEYMSEGSSATLIHLAETKEEKKSSNYSFDNYGYEQTTLPKNVTTSTSSIKKKSDYSTESRIITSRSLKNVRDVFIDEECSGIDTKKSDVIDIMCSELPKNHLPPLVLPVKSNNLKSKNDTLISKANGINHDKDKSYESSTTLPGETIINKDKGMRLLEIFQMTPGAFSSFQYAGVTRANIDSSLFALRSLVKKVIGSESKFVFVSSDKTTFHPGTEKTVLVRDAFKKQIKIKMITDDAEIIGLYCICGEPGIFKCMHCLKQSYCGESCKQKDYWLHKKNCVK